MNTSKKIIIGLLLSLILGLSISTVASADEAEDAAAGILCFSGLLCILPIIAIIISILIAIWVYKDAEKRGSSGALWLIIVILTGIIGLIIWLVIRPPIGGKPGQQHPKRMCPGCGREIPPDAQVCPYCGKKFGQ